MEDKYHLLTENNRKTLDFIIQYQKDNGYSPSLEEIKKAIETHSTRGVSMQLEKLSKLGYIKRDPNSRRSIRVLITPDITYEMLKVPVVGSVKAGYGGITEQNLEEYKDIPISLTGGRRDVVLLKIRGESMTKAGFNPGDLVIVAPQSTAFDGDIVIVYDPNDDEETIKRFKKLRNYAVLLPESHDLTFKPKIGTDFQIQGKVLGKFTEN